MIHNFHEDLSWGEQASDEPFWEDVYRKAFPDIVKSVKNDASNTGQQLGIDRLVLLNSGVMLKVDEKKRRNDYGDILLEVQSNDQKRTPGWMDKDLQIDFLAYAFVDSQRCYLFPWQPLRRVWLNHREEWIGFLKESWKRRDPGANRGASVNGGFVCIKAQNRSYNTWSLAVPTALLLAKVGEWMTVSLASEAA